MVTEKQEQPKCGACKEVIGDIWQGYVYCAYLHCDVWANSLMCQHGKDLDEIW